MLLPTQLVASNANPISLYSSKQIYAMEQAWFNAGHDSFGLMQQAAWQMAQNIETLYDNKHLNKQLIKDKIAVNPRTSQRRASIWVGKGNNGGDGWLIAYYLQQLGWKVQVMTLGFEKDDFIIEDNLQNKGNPEKKEPLTDAIKALRLALSAHCSYQYFESSVNQEDSGTCATVMLADVYIDALFGIGLDRAPSDIYQQAICAFNERSAKDKALVVAVDIPSGLVASTGQVFEHLAIKADATLCLIARKFGLHTKDGLDYSGAVIDIPLIPYQINNEKFAPVATLIQSAYGLSSRRQNSHKGSYGHVLIIGGNRIDGSQGMGGAAILSASSAMATGAGKITVACHEAFHGALLTSLPDAMTISLHYKDAVKNLIKEASVIAIGMGLGRDDKAKSIFIEYLQAAMVEGKPLIIDADGLYHLASLQNDEHKLIAQLKEHSLEQQVCLTPHSGEAARLLDKQVSEIESDRLSAITACAKIYGGNWVLKGAGSLILEQTSEKTKVYVCGLGNSGMASAGMGDVLSGVITGLLAQQDLEDNQRSLRQAVVIHGLSGDILVNQTTMKNDNSLIVGQRGLQAQDMPAAIRHVMQLITDSQ